MTRRTDTEPADPREALVEVVANAIVYGIGAWAEHAAGARKGNLDQYALAAEFLAAYRLPVEVDSALADVNDALRSAQLDARVHGAGFLRVDIYSRLNYVDPDTLTLHGPQAHRPDQETR